jgi:hypothetical protein
MLRKRGKESFSLIYLTVQTDVTVTFSEHIFAIDRTSFLTSQVKA